MSSEPHRKQGVPMTETYIREAQPVLTNKQHDCGNVLYHVGSDQALFCPHCQEQVSDDD